MLTISIINHFPLWEAALPYTTLVNLKKTLCFLELCFPICLLRVSCIFCLLSVKVLDTHEGCLEKSWEQPVPVVSVGGGLS